MPLLVSVLPTDLSRSRGGGERCAFEIHANLTRLLPGWEARALGATADPAREPLPDGWQNLARSDPHAQDALDVRRLLRAIPRDADLVVAHQWWTRSTLALRLRPRRGGTLVAIDHGGGSLGAARVSRLPLPAVDVAAVQSDYERRVTPMRGRRFVNMRGGIVEDLFTPPERDERDVDFLIVARFVPHKGQREFLQALPPGASARLVGPSGTYDEAYQREVLALAAERGARVDLDLSDAELVEAYRRARFTVQVPIARPGDAPELLGLTMLEAMACGSVPISPTGGPSAEFARDGETGVEYRAGDVDDLRRAMTAALADDEARRRLADAALEESARWTWRAAAQTLIDTAGVS